MLSLWGGGGGGLDLWYRLQQAPGNNALTNFSDFIAKHLCAQLLIVCIYK